MGNAWVFPSISHSITASTASDNVLSQILRKGSEKNEYLRGLAKDIWVLGMGEGAFYVPYQKRLFKINMALRAQF